MSPQRVLIVADQTIGSEALATAVARRIMSEFVLLVPVRQSSEPALLTFLPVEAAAMAIGSPSDLKNLAEQRLATGLDWLRSLGASAIGVLGDVHLVECVTTLVARSAIDEVIVSTLTPPLSRWLRQDIPSRLRKALAVPVTVVSAD